MRRIAIGWIVSVAVFADGAEAQSGFHNAVLQDGTRITAQGNPAPGGGSYSNFSNVQVDGGGDLAFIATLTGASGSSGVFEITSGVHSAVAIANQTAPNPPGTYTSFSAVDLNDAGTVVFRTVIQRALARTAILSDVGGVKTVVAEQGQPVPGVVGPVYNIPASPAINDGGAVAFSSTLLPGTNASVFLASGGPPAAIVTSGEATPIGGTYATGSPFGAIDVDDANRVFFRAAVTGGTAPSAIFVLDAGVESVLVAEGDAAPGGSTFASFSAFSVNTSGQLAFVASLASSLSGIYLREPGGSISALVLQNDSAPGTSGGIFQNLLLVGAPSLNDAGDVVFAAEIVGGTGGTGVFRVPAGGALEAVAVVDGVVPSVPATTYVGNFALPEVDDAGVASYPARLFSNDDGDGDGYLYLDDNCPRTPNPTQCDVDFDGAGNHCDGDFDNNGAVGAVDYNKYFVPDFKAGVDQFNLGTDMNCNGQVNAVDFNTHFVPQFKKGSPGETAVHCAGTVPCDL